MGKHPKNAPIQLAEKDTSVLLDERLISKIKNEAFENGRKQGYEQGLNDGFLQSFEKIDTEIIPVGFDDDETAAAHVEIIREASERFKKSLFKKIVDSIEPSYKTLSLGNRIYTVAEASFINGIAYMLSRTDLIKQKEY